MNKITRKIASVGLTLTTAVWLSGATMIIPVASAQTTADLQAQIAALLAQITALQAQLNAGSGTSMPAYNFTRNLTVGSVGDDVKALQQWLNGHGYQVATSGAGAPGAESTYFGLKTKAALAAFQAANGVSPAVGYFGPLTRAKVAAMGGTTGTGTGTGTVVPSGFYVSLASDNPAAGSLPKGATGVTLMKFNVSGSGTLSSITFIRKGIGSTADFGSSGFYLYDGNTRLTTGRTINSTTHEIQFLNLNLAVSGTKTLTFVGNIASGATASNASYFEMVSALGTPNPTGTLMSNTMTIGGQTVGGLDPTSGAAPANPKVGQQDAKIGEFKLTASSTEDVNIYRIAVTEGGTVANSNLANFELKQGGNVLATAAAVGDKDLVTFNFTTPFKLEKGQERTFEVFADISGGTRSGDTIVLYFDSASDIYALGATYGYPVLPTIGALDATSEGDTLTIAGGDVTITMNGPISGDIALRGQDVEIFNFTIASLNNIEIKNLRLHATTTGLGSGEGFNDFKVWDMSTNAVITSAVDITTSTDQTFTDVLNVNAGQAKTYKVTADVDADDDDSDTVLVSLNAFQSNDIRNLDNNTYVATSVIVPNSTVAGNTMTVKVPSLDIQLSSNPSSQTYVKGKQNADLVGLSFRAISSDIKLSAVRITASSSSGTLTSGELQSLGLYDGATLISTTKSLDTTALNATFDNLNYTIAQGVTKLFTVKGNIASDATNGDVFYVYLATAGTSDITAYDKDGNAATLTGTAANSGNSVNITVANVGDITVVKAADDVESEAGIVTANGERVLGKFRFTAANEQMTINKMKILVIPTNSATATSAASADEVPVVKLYDGSTLVGSTSGYTVQASGDNSGEAVIENLGWVVGKDENKTLTVKGTLNSISGGADTGASVYVSVMSSAFEAQGASAKDTTITAATGNEKVVYKTKPTITVSSAGGSLAAGQVPIIRFTVAADSAEQVAWRKVQLSVTMTGATMSAADANPGTTGNVKIKDVGSSSNLNISTAFSHASSASASTTATITGGSVGYLTLILNSEEIVAAGGSKTYEVSATFADLTSTAGGATAVVKLYKDESTKISATTYNAVETSDSFGQTNGSPSFIWSDYSVVGHSNTTSDWANGIYVKTLPSDSFTTKN